MSDRPLAPIEVRRILVGALCLHLSVVALPTPAATQDWTSVQLSRQLQEEREIEVTVRYSSGQLAISGADSPRLFAARLRYDADRHGLLHEFGEGRLVLGIEGTGRNPILRRGNHEADMGLTLSTRIPMDLTLELGAVRSELELGGLRLRTLHIETGASDGELRVSEPNPEEMEWARIRVGAASFRARGLGHLNAAVVDLEAGLGDIRLGLEGLRRSETRVRVKLGVGNVEIRVPREAGIRLTRNSFLATLNAPGLERREAALYSSNWESAAARVHIEVDAALGNVTIIRIDP